MSSYGCEDFRMRHQPYINVILKRSFAPWMKKKNSTIIFSSRHKMYRDKMAMISAFSQLVLLLVIVTAEVTSAVNSILPVVHTVSNVTLISGMEGTLTCHYNRTVYAVYWKYENTTSPSELLVALDKYYDVGKRSGLGYDIGRFNMTDDYSLIIHDVQATDEGRYICEVADYETGSLFRSHTDVITVVTAERPFIRIGQCEDDVSADKINEPCVLHTTSDDPSIELTCTVLGAKPMVDLTWESSLSAEHWKQVMNESTLSTRDRGNGVFDQTLTIIVDTSYFKSKKQHFTCVGKGLAVDGIANYMIAVYPAQVGSYGTRAAVISIVCILIFTFVIIGVMLTWRRVRRRRQKGEDPENQEEVNTPLTQIDGDALESKRESDETSAQIEGDALKGKRESDAPTARTDGDALESKGESDVPTTQREGDALRNKEELDAPAGEDPEKQEDTSTHLTQIDGDAIESKEESDAPSEKKAPKNDKRESLERIRTKICNYRPHITSNKATTYMNIWVFGLTNAGKSSFINSLNFALKAGAGATAADSPKYGSFTKESIWLTEHIKITNFKGMTNFELDQVERLRREIKGQGKVIFICDYSTYKEHCRDLLKRFLDHVSSCIGKEITVVVTKKNTIGGDDTIKKIKEEADGVTKKQIWIFESYTRDNHEEDVGESKEFLKFIWQCLDVVKANQQVRKDLGEKEPFIVCSTDSKHALHRKAKSDSPKRKQTKKINN